MISISIVEDDASYADLLKHYLDQYQQENGQQFQIAHYRDGLDFLEHYSIGTDIVFMDIRMAAMDGMEAARALRKLDSLAVLIFITSLTQYAIQGYEVNALDYIVKPVRYSHFARKLERALRNLPVREHWCAIPTKAGLIRLAYDRIYYAESRNHQIFFHTAEGVFQTRSSLSAVEQELRGFGFSRPNNSFLVNLNHVQTIRANQVVVHGREFFIGRSRKIAFMQDLTAYLGGHLSHE